MSQPEHGILKRQKTSFTPDSIPLRILYQCYFCSNGLAMLIFAILSYAAFEDSWTQYNLILENWQQPLITDIRATNQSCLLTEVQLTQYVWPGTQAGCQCDSIFGDSGLSSGSCTTNQTRRGCRSVDSMNSVKMSNFPIDNFTYYTLCAQVDKNNTFYKNAPDKQCQPNQLKCGNQDDYFVCSNTNKCPIFDVSSTNNYSDGNISLPGGNFLYYTRKLDGQMPVVQFGIGEGSGLCIDSSDPSITQGRSDYTLMNVKKVDCPSDSRYTKLASASEPSFYKVNNLDNLPNVLPGYSISSQYTWGIFKRGYIFWNSSCRGDTLKSFINSRTDLDQILQYQKGQLIIAIIFVFIVSIGMSIMVLVNICGGDWPCISGKGAEEANKLLNCEITMKVICQLAYLIIIFMTFILVDGKFIYFNQLFKQNCTDSQTKDVLKLLKESLIDKIYTYNLVLLILFMLGFGVDLCVFGYFLLKNYNENSDEIGTINNQIVVNQEPGYFPFQDVQLEYQEQARYQDYPIQQQGQPGNQDQNPFQGSPMQGYPQGNQPVNQYPHQQPYQQPFVQQPFVQQPYQAPFDQQYPLQQQHPQKYPQQVSQGKNYVPPQGNPFQ